MKISIFETAQLEAAKGLSKTKNADAGGKGGFAEVMGEQMKADTKEKETPRRVSEDKGAKRIEKRPQASSKKIKEHRHAEASRKAARAAKAAKAKPAANEADESKPAAVGQAERCGQAQCENETGVEESRDTIAAYEGDSGPEAVEDAEATGKIEQAAFDAGKWAIEEMEPDDDEESETESESVSDGQEPIPAEEAAVVPDKLNAMAAIASLTITENLADPEHVICAEPADEGATAAISPAAAAEVKGNAFQGAAAQDEGVQDEAVLDEAVQDEVKPADTEKSVTETSVFSEGESAAVDDAKGLPALNAEETKAAAAQRPAKADNPEARESNNDAVLKPRGQELISKAKDAGTGDGMEVEADSDNEDETVELPADVRAGANKYGQVLGRTVKNPKAFDSEDGFAGQQGSVKGTAAAKPGEQQSGAFTLSAPEAAGAKNEPAAVEQELSGKAQSIKHEFAGISAAGEKGGPTAPAARPAAAVRGAEVFEQIRDGLKMTMAQGAKEMRISLHPDHLGELHIKISVEGGAVKANITVDNAGVKSLLDADAGKLKELFGQHGLQLERYSIEVGHNASSLGNSADPGNNGLWESFRENASNNNHSNRKNGERGAEAAPYARAVENDRKPSGGVDLFI